MSGHRWTGPAPPCPQLPAAALSERYVWPQPSRLTSPAQSRHLGQWSTWISRKYSQACDAVCVSSPVTHPSRSGQFPPDCLLRRGVSPGRSLRSPEIYIPSASPRSHSSVPRGQRPADTPCDSKIYLSIYLSISTKVQNKMLCLCDWRGCFSSSLELCLYSPRLYLCLSQEDFCFSPVVITASEQIILNVWNSLCDWCPKICCTILWFCGNDCFFINDYF